MQDSEEKLMTPDGFAEDLSTWVCDYCKRTFRTASMSPEIVKENAECPTCHHTSDWEAKLRCPECTTKSYWKGRKDNDPKTN